MSVAFPLPEVLYKRNPLTPTRWSLKASSSGKIVLDVLEGELIRQSWDGEDFIYSYHKRDGPVLFERSQFAEPVADIRRRR